MTELRQIIFARDFTDQVEAVSIRRIDRNLAVIAPSLPSSRSKPKKAAVMIVVGQAFLQKDWTALRNELTCCVCRERVGVDPDFTVVRTKSRTIIPDDDFAERIDGNRSLIKVVTGLTEVTFVKDGISVGVDDSLANAP